jgi:hypothetical protein
VYCDHQKPNFWPSHTHGLVQITIAFDGADYDASWAGADGRRVNQRIKADQIWILPAAVEQEVHWRQTADLIVLYVETAAVRGFCGQVPVTPSIRPVREYIDREPAIGMLCDDLRRQARQFKFDHERHIGAVGTLLASFVEIVSSRSSHRTVRFPDCAAVFQLLRRIEEPCTSGELSIALRRFCRCRHSAPTVRTAERKMLQQWDLRQPTCDAIPPLAPRLP